MEQYYYKNKNDQNEIYDIYDLFWNYDKAFFNNQLQNCELKWSKKMTLCAGTCKY